MLREFFPGIALSVCIALSAAFAEQFFPFPATVIALLIGVLLNPIACRAIYQSGMTFCVKVLLRWAIALLGLKVLLKDIWALGVSTILITVVGMAVALGTAFYIGHFSEKKKGLAALSGAATAVCGASAALATASVVPEYKGKNSDIAFVVVAANALATLGMILFPLLAGWLGFNTLETGIFLGATIHDVAQVAGASQGIPDGGESAAVVVKLLRVFLLLPVVFIIGWYFSRSSQKSGDNAKIPVPLFAIVFLVLCLVNSFFSVIFPSLKPFYETIRFGFLEASRWGLLIAISALGLGTSVQTIIQSGWRQGAPILGASFMIVISVLFGLFTVRYFS